MIADGLKDESIPYKYECPLMVNGIKVNPDFTIMHPKTLEIYYWEHFGLMGDETYRAEVVWKSSQYAKAGIITGKNLIVTFEDAVCPLTPQTIKAIIRGIFVVK